jgi:protein phosphatase
LIPAEQAHLHVAAVTHPGMKGKNNEDRYAVSAHWLSETNRVPSLLAVIADGVGGHRAGEVAAEMAVELICQIVSESDASQPTAILNEAISQASRAIYTRSLEDPALQGMSTTCVCAWVIGDRLYTASVGDSRIYLFRGSMIYRLTIDHTWVQEALETGALTPDEARKHPNAHVIRRHLGSQQPVVPDFRLRLSPEETADQAEANQGMQLLPGDSLLLCSDGLTDLVGDGEILEALMSAPLQPALERLVRLANSRGGHDNITIVSMQVPERETVVAALPRRRRPVLAWFVWIVISLVLLGALIFAGLFWLQGGFGPRITPTPTRAAVVQPTFLPPEIVVPLGTPVEPTPSALASPAAPTPTAQLTTVPTLVGPRPTYTPWPTFTPAPLSGTLSP